MSTKTRLTIHLSVGILTASLAITTAPICLASSALSLGPSIRAAGTGGASGAAFWGGDPDVWANPAMLGYHRGIRFSGGQTDPVAGSSLAFETGRWSAAYGGIGVMGSGTPQHFTRTELVDDALPGTERTAERVDVRAAGISLGDAISSVMALAGAAPPAIFRRLDVAMGAAENRMSVALAPGSKASGRTTDYGVMVRWTPVNTLNPRPVAAAPAPSGNWRWPQANDPARTRRARDPRAGMFPDLRPRRREEPRRFDLAYGFSVKNAARRALEYPDGTTQPLARIVRHGMSASLAQGRPGGHAPWITRAFSPLYAAGIVGDLERVDPTDGGDRYDIERYGAEATFANVFTLRRGRVKDGSAGIDGATSGYSMGIDLGYVGGVRFDRAREPQPNGKPDLTRRGFSAWIDPLVVLRAARGRPRGMRR